MKNKSNLELAELIVKAIEGADTVYDEIEAVENVLDTYTLVIKKGPIHEMNHTNTAWQLRWDYEGWKNISPSESSMIQNDWNVTLLTKLNQLSAQIGQTKLKGGASTIKTNPKMEELFKTIVYYEDSSFGGRFDVVYDETIKEGDIYIHSEDWNSVMFMPNKDGTEIKQISNFTDEEISRYNKQLIGCVRIDNLPKLEVSSKK